VDVANVRQRCAALPIDLLEAVTQRSPRAEETLADIGRRNAQLPADLIRRSILEIAEQKTHAVLFTDGL